MNSYPSFDEVSQMSTAKKLFLATHLVEKKRELKANHWPLNYKYLSYFLLILMGWFCPEISIVVIAYMCLRNYYSPKKELKAIDDEFNFIKLSLRG